MSDLFSSLPVRRIEEHRLAPISRDTWPAGLPAVRQILDEGLDFSPLTVFVGENGAGKSTIVEAVAEAYGLGVEGGTRNSLHRTQRTESGLAEHLQLVRGAGSSRQGVFLRAETMHGHFSYLDDVGVSGVHNYQSHGESFVEFFATRSGIGGLWVFDEAESALSFNGCLALLAHIRELLASGSQVIMSTHSPILASLPEAKLFEIGEWGLRDREYDELDMVQSWRSFLDAPGRYLRHLTAGGRLGD
ncbi:AAA family ATPase [Rhodococcus gordoniae]|uniref:AAA family ATPase n=1 Tax=Rhodococcus gordoniae TaxID=223392 RepID=UPI0007CD8452|nr:AAA family ATPase [Rhodococcus gordoniae]